MPLPENGRGRLAGSQYGEAARSQRIGVCCSPNRAGTCHGSRRISVAGRVRCLAAGSSLTNLGHLQALRCLASRVSPRAQNGGASGPTVAPAYRAFRFIRENVSGRAVNQLRGFLASWNRAVISSRSATGNSTLRLITMLCVPSSPSSQTSSDGR
jgi:hypothetical protein